jgi:hypothetical protein
LIDGKMIFAQDQTKSSQILHYLNLKLVLWGKKYQHGLSEGGIDGKTW